MRRLPLALALAAALVLTVVVKVSYMPPRTDAVITGAYYSGGGGYYTIYISYNTTLPPPIILIAATNATIIQYDSHVTTKLGAEYVGNLTEVLIGDHNYTAVMYEMMRMPRGGGIDVFTVYIQTTGGTVLWVSTDGKTWAPIRLTPYSVS